MKAISKQSSFPPKGQCPPPSSVLGENKLLQRPQMKLGFTDPVTKLRFSCPLLESQYSRDSVGRKGKVALFRRPVTWGEGGLVSTANSQQPIRGKNLERDVSGVHRRREGLYVEPAQAAPTGILNLVIGGLVSVILMVLGTVSLQFQGQFPFL